MIQNATLEFSQVELLLLSLKLGMPLKGIDYSIISQLEEKEILVAWETHRETLASKGYLGNEHEERLEVDAFVIESISACHDSKDVFILQISENGKLTKLVNYYFQNEVTLIEKFSDISQYTVSNLENLTVTENHIKEILSLPTSTKADDTSISLSNPQYYKFMAFVHMGATKANVDLLTSMGMDEQVALDAVVGFMEKKYIVSFTHLGSGESTEQILYYKGEEYLWGISLGDEHEESFRISMMSPEDVFLSIQTLIHQVRE